VREFFLNKITVIRFYYLNIICSIAKHDAHYGINFEEINDTTKVPNNNFNFRFECYIFEISNSSITQKRKLRMVKKQ
jgi:hypothetical protein